MNQGSIKWISCNELDIVRPILSLTGGYVFQSISSWGVESPTLCQVFNSGIIWWDSFNAQVLWVKLPGSRSPQTRPYSDWMLLSGSIWVNFYRSSHSQHWKREGSAPLVTVTMSLAKKPADTAILIRKKKTQTPMFAQAQNSVFTPRNSVQCQTTERNLNVQLCCERVNQNKLLLHII